MSLTADSKYLNIRWVFIGSRIIRSVNASPFETAAAGGTSFEMEDCSAGYSSFELEDIAGYSLVEIEIDLKN